MAVTCMYEMRVGVIVSAWNASDRLNILRVHQCVFCYIAFVMLINITVTHTALFLLGVIGDNVPATCKRVCLRLWPLQRSEDLPGMMRVGWRSRESGSVVEVSQ